MPAGLSEKQLLRRIQELENRLQESEELIEAIKAGEVDAFAINSEDKSEIFTLQTGDYAYRVLIEEFGEGAINVTEDGLIVYTNSSFYDLLKLPYESVIGASLFDFVHTGSKGYFKELFRKALTGKSNGEINLIAGDKVIPVYISLTSLQPKLATIGVIVADFSEKKKNENTILAYQKSLEAKNYELLQSNSELASFAYIASHDLQEPLRKIQTFASRVQEKESVNLSERGKDYFARIQLASQRMQTLIEDLLTYSRTNTVERRFEKTDLRKMVEEVMADLKEELQQKECTLEVDISGEVYVIPFQFRQLLHNLIGNSLKFSHPERPLRILIKSETGKGAEFGNSRLENEINYCKITIADNGIGFDQQYSVRIFELFQRLHGRSEYTGTGIGLAIVKKIVENHRGIIEAKGEPEKGAKFEIYIPNDENSL